MALTKEQYLLAKLAEESTEVGQIVLKTLLFTQEEKREGQPFTNKERVHQELNDLMGVIRVLNRDFNFGYVVPTIVTPDYSPNMSEQLHLELLDKNNQAVFDKEKKLEHYRRHCEDLGTVQESTPDMDRF